MLLLVQASFKDPCFPHQQCHRKHDLNSACELLTYCRNQDSRGRSDDGSDNKHAESVARLMPVRLLMALVRIWTMLMTMVNADCEEQLRTVSLHMFTLAHVRCLNVLVLTMSELPTTVEAKVGRKPHRSIKDNPRTGRDELTVSLWSPKRFLSMLEDRIRNCLVLQLMRPRPLQKSRGPSF